MQKSVNLFCQKAQKSVNLFCLKMQKSVNLFFAKMRKIAKCLICKLEKERNVYVLSTWQDGYQLLPACCIFLEKSFFARKLCRRYFSLWQFVGISDIPLRLIVFQLVTVFSKCNCDRTADGITYLLLREVYICT